MTDLVRYAQVRQLLEEVEDVEGELADNERDMIAYLRTNYEDPSHNETHAIRLLETILRNVEIRRGYETDGSGPAPRKIDLERKPH